MKYTVRTQIKSVIEIIWTCDKSEWCLSDSETSVWSESVRNEWKLIAKFLLHSEWLEIKTLKEMKSYTWFLDGIQNDVGVKSESSISPFLMKGIPNLDRINVSEEVSESEWLLIKSKLRLSKQEVIKKNKLSKRMYSE